MADAVSDADLAKKQERVAKLRAQLAASKEAAKVGNVRSGASGPLAAAQEQAAAVAASGPSAVVTPTNGEGS